MFEMGQLPVVQWRLRDEGSYTSLIVSIFFPGEEAINRVVSLDKDVDLEKFGEEDVRKIVGSWEAFYIPAIELKKTNYIVKGG